MVSFYYYYLKHSSLAIDILIKVQIVKNAAIFIGITHGIFERDTKQNIRVIGL